MDQDLTLKIKNWLDAPAAERDTITGARLLLQITRNQIIFRNAMQRPERYADRVAYELRKAYNTRLNAVTKAEVSALMAQVEAINVARGLDKPQDEERTEFQRGKRADHDELPEPVQRLWEDNAEIMKKMRDCHTHLRLITPENSTCPDSDRYPWAKEIIRLDKEYRKNFNLYDHYIKGLPLAATTLVVDPRTEDKNAVKTINLALGRYVKNPSEELAEQIKALYAKIGNPTDKLVAKMSDAGLLDAAPSEPATVPSPDPEPKPETEPEPEPTPDEVTDAPEQ